MLNPIRNPISELCIEYTFSTSIDRDINDKILTIYNHLIATLDLNTLGILDIIPTYTTIAVHFRSDSPLFQRPDYLDEVIQGAEAHSLPERGQTFEIEVDYSGEDLAYACETLGLTKNAFVTLHADRPYPVAMLGFRPYFPYLLGLDERLALARREDPRLRVKKGSVAIGAGQTGLYSEESPGGWHIIGHTDFDDFEKLRPSDIIIFRELKDRDAD